VVYRGKISLILHHPLPRIISVPRNETVSIKQNYQTIVHNNSKRAESERQSFECVCVPVHNINKKRSDCQAG